MGIRALATVSKSNRLGVDKPGSDDGEPEGAVMARSPCPRTGAVELLLFELATPGPICNAAAARVRCFRRMPLPSTTPLSAIRSRRMVANPTDTPLSRARVIPMVYASIISHLGHQPGEHLSDAFRNGRPGSTGSHAQKGIGWSRGSPEFSRYCH